MDYATSIRIRNMTNEVLDSKAEASLKEEMNRTQHVRKIVLAYFKNNDEGLKHLLLENDIDVTALGISRNRFTMALFVADAMLRGVASICQVCNRRGLIKCHGRVVCKGFLEGSSVRCPFRASQVEKRRKFVLPEIYNDITQDVWIDRKKKNKKRRRARDLGSIGELPGLELKDSVTKSPSRKKKPPPKRERPEKGSPILQVHRNYEQTGRERLASVVVDEDGVTVYNAILNQVDLSRDQNRYYVLQLLKVRSKKSFRYELFRTEGRIGRKYEHESRASLSNNYKCYDFGQDLKKAILEFKTWFKKKTGGFFESRHALVQRPGSYAFVELSTKNIEKSKKRSRDAMSSSSSSDTQDSAVYKFVSIISDDSTLEYTMKEAGLNIEELPLGALTRDVLKNGRDILMEIETILSSSPTTSLDLKEDENGVISLIESDEDDNEEEDDDDASNLLNLFQTKDDMQETLWRSKLAAKSTLFYTKIPSRHTSVIDTKKSVQEKLALLDILEDVLTASTLTDEQDDDKDTSEISAKYRALGCKLEPLDKSNPVLAEIETALKNTSKKHVSSPAYTHSICNVFEVIRPNQEERGELQASKKRRGRRNRRLLFHGAPMGVVASILKSGLRIMPGSGGRLGKGIYLADMAAKSGAYARPTVDGLACLFLCEAECGRPFIVTCDSNEAMSRKSPPKNFQSVQAHGYYVPDSKGDITMSFGSNQVTFCTGEPTMRQPLDSDKRRLDFAHNEYVLYKEKKVRLRYVILVDLKTPLLGL